MVTRDVVVVGASAGGVEALRSLVGSLPADLPAAVLVVLHIPPRAPSALPLILRRSGPLPAAHGIDGEELRYGRIYVAPADRHLLVHGGRIALSAGPPENGHRPAVDPLFRSAARFYGERVVGVVLSGARDDGAAGLVAISARGGLTVVQDPAEALHPSMPRSALERVQVEHTLATVDIGALLEKVTTPRASGPAFAPPLDRTVDQEVGVAEHAPDGDPDYLSVPAAVRQVTVTHPATGARDAVS